jgi:hypothetical protein
VLRVEVRDIEVDWVSPDGGPAQPWLDLGLYLLAAEAAAREPAAQESAHPRSVVAKASTRGCGRRALRVARVDTRRARAVGRPPAAAALCHLAAPFTALHALCGRLLRHLQAG